MKKVSKISKEFETILKPYNDDIKRHMSALSEEFQGRVKVVAEQFGGLNAKVDKIQNTLESHTEMIGTLLVDITVVKGDAKSIKESLKTKVSRKKFFELEKRVLAE